MTQHSNHMIDSKTVRLPYFNQAVAYLSLAMTQRRLAHIARREALAWEAAGDYRRYGPAAVEARRLWREAKWHLERAKMNRGKAFR
jgi:hypothetical protein